MKKIIIPIIMLLLIINLVSAFGANKTWSKDNYDEMSCGKSYMKHDSGYAMKYKYGKTHGFVLLKLIYFVIIVFIFSIIFWLTRNWLVKDKKKR